MGGEAAEADQWVAYFVQDSPGQLPHELDLFGMAQRFQHLFPFAQVGEDGHIELGGAIPVFHGADAFPDQKFRAVFPPVDEAVDVGLP